MIGATLIGKMGFRILLIVALATGVVGTSLDSACAAILAVTGTATTATATPSPFSRPLVFPPVNTNASVPIGIDAACVQILDGPCTNMWTYGGTYPGLTIRRPTGQTTHVTFTNNLDPGIGALTVHNHGNHSSPENDGQPDDFLIAAG